MFFTIPRKKHTKSLGVMKDSFFADIVSLPPLDRSDNPDLTRTDLSRLIRRFEPARFYDGVSKWW